MENFYFAGIAEGRSIFVRKISRKTYWPEVLPMEIGKRIRHIRGKQSRKAFAQSIGIVENTLRNYEEGLSLPNSDVIAEICQKLRIAPYWLLFGDGPEGQAAPCLHVSPATCPRCMELYDKLVQVQERENALLKENHALKAENMCLQDRRSLSAIANGESQQASTA